MAQVDINILNIFLIDKKKEKENPKSRDFILYINGPKVKKEEKVRVLLLMSEKGERVSLFEQLTNHKFED